MTSIGTEQDGRSLEQRVAELIDGMIAGCLGPKTIATRVVPFIREQIASDIDGLRAAALGQPGYALGNTTYNEAIERAVSVARGGSS